MSHVSQRCHTCGARMSGGEPVLGPGRVAQLFGVSRRTISDWVRSGKLESINPGGVARIPAREVERLLAQGGASS
jgi:excisionase family DNA binding protein